jgi:hypothetical protein
MPDTLLQPKTPVLDFSRAGDLAIANEKAEPHAVRILNSLGFALSPAASAGSEAHQLAWAQSGAMSLTGNTKGPPRLIAAPLALAAQGAFTALRALTPAANPAVRPSLDSYFPSKFNPATLLAERAAIAGYSRSGAQSAGGSCRLLTTADGCIALNLTRGDDWEQLPALLSNNTPQETIARDDWDALARNLYEQKTAELIELAQLLGLALADANAPPSNRDWCRLLQAGVPTTPSLQLPLVVDLSALWAGPLCANLLGFAGARVIKVESLHRPDGARDGPRAFFDLMNGNKESLALDLRSDAGTAQLLTLLQQADIVIESSRPRALRQMGISAEALVADKPGKVWLSITGYGRDAANELRIAYGDDAGVAAGLSRSLLDHYGEYGFCGDAIADPLTGLHAAVAASAAWWSGSGGLLDLSLEAVVSFCSQPQQPINLRVEQCDTGWQLTTAGEATAVALPLARVPAASAKPLGADTQALMREFSLL